MEAFDPELRKELGVWYTPPEIVQYMVARVDTVLREELQIEDGLADPNVYILDPCCGTGAYLVEVLRRIDANLQDKGMGALVGSQLKAAAMNRVFGFEILTAPFVVAHLQLGLLLQNLGVPLSDEQERVGVYLTNALTGWEPPTEEAKTKFKQLAISYPELEQEREAADEVKQGKPILVVLGNPPYNAFVGVSPKEEEGLVEPYKEGLISEWGIKKFNLDDLYVRFFRLAERCIAERRERKGVVCYISNNSWVADKSFVVLRQHLLKSFDRFWIENMHGDRSISEYAPDGRTSETIFAIPGFSAGIKQGVVVSLWVKTGNKEETQPLTLFRDDINAAKAAERRIQLLETLNDNEFDSRYEVAKPVKHNYLSFLPGDVASHYLEWAKLTELCAEAPINGLFEKRGGALIDINQDALSQRMEMFYDPNISWEILEALNTGLTKKAAGFEPKKVRTKVQNSETYSSERLHRYAVRPFDIRWCYYSSVSPLWNRARQTFYAQLWKGNSFLMSRPAGVANPEGVPLFYSKILGDNDFLRGHAYYFPLRLRSTSLGTSDKAVRQMGIEGLGSEEDLKITANLSNAARRYLLSLGISEPDNDPETAELVWMHVLAIGYSPAYLEENTDGIRQDWLRIPLPDQRETLIASANLGRQIAALLDPETPVGGVTSGKLRAELKAIAVVSRVGTGNLNPNTDFALTAGWGYAGQKGVTMPGKGKAIDRPYTPEEQTAIAQVIEQLGTATYDIYLNDIAYWKNIPDRVWNYTIGGYQVIKKWLSYREQKLLGRSLKPEEVIEVTQMARRIAAILLLEPELDTNYEAVKQSTYQWSNQGEISLKP
ncbi:MAG: type ISP restriction/modification enzyme [Coleofasciculus sp. G1-WW12-02]